MSLILEALRKADAERERGTVPGLHAQPAPPADAERLAPARPPHWWWAGIGVAVGLVAAVALFMLGRGGSAPDSAAGSTPRVSPAPASSAPAGGAPAVLAAPAPFGPPVPIAEPAPWPATEVRKGPDRAPAGAAVPAPQAAEANAVAPEHLPESIRAQLPALTFGGSIYSSNAASRSLIVNGRLLRESEQVLPGLTLEQIKPNGAVFNFKGYRFEVLL